MCYTHVSMSSPPIKQVACKTYYDGQNLLTIMSCGGLSIGAAHLTWLVALQQQLKFFLLPFLFSLMCIGCHPEPLKIQICPPACICFKIGTNLFIYFKAS